MCCRTAAKPATGTMSNEGSDWSISMKVPSNHRPGFASHQSFPGKHSTGSPSKEKNSFVVAMDAAELSSEFLVGKPPNRCVCDESVCLFYTSSALSEVWVLVFFV